MMLKMAADTGNSTNSSSRPHKQPLMTLLPAKSKYRCQWTGVVILIGAVLLHCTPGQTAVPESQLRPVTKTGKVATDPESLCKKLGVYCREGHCVNDTLAGPRCVCDKGWKGAACDSCGGRVKVTESEGIIMDGYTNYTLDTKCTWLVEGPTAETVIRLRFTHFATECSWDHLYIYNGSSVWHPQVAVFSGLMIASRMGGFSMPEVVTTGAAYIYFFSDAAYNMSGFNITYKMDTCAWDCSGHGDCQSDGTCACKEGWKGDGCREEECPENCHNIQGQGHCDDSQQEHVCVCESNFQGPDCSRRVNLGLWEQISPTPSDNIPHPRASHKTVMQDDRMWVVSGFDFGQESFQNLVRYNFHLMKWEKFEPISSFAVWPQQRYGHTIGLYQTDYIYMYGGLVDKKITDELWEYHIDSNQWRLVSAGGGADPLGVVGHSAHIIGHTMYVIFGHSPVYGYLNGVQRYNIYEGKWQRTESWGATVKGGYGHTSTYDPKSRLIYVHAGYHSKTYSSYVLTDVMYTYEPNTGFWRILRSSGQPKFLHSAVLLNNMILVFGGNTHNDTEFSLGAQCYSASFMMYDIECDLWHTLDSPHLNQDISRFGHTAEVYADKMYVFGGFNGVVLNDFYRYQPGSCQAHRTERECLSIHEGTKCVWADQVECISPLEGSIRRSYKNIQDINSGRCHAKLPEESEKMCPTFGTCPSCTENTYTCLWCQSECAHKCDTPADTPDLPVDCSSANYSKYSQNCAFLHNCAACEAEKGVCAWDERDCRLEMKPAEKEEECPAPCHTHVECEQCTGQSCMWCSNMERCVESNSYVASFPYGQCMEWTTMKSKCPATRCENLRTCEDCQANPSCGWCDDGSNTGLGTCMQGGQPGPVSVVDDQATPAPERCLAQHWFFTSCPLCQCNGHSQCLDDTAHCIACEDNTTGDQCEICRDGFWGNPTNGGNCSECECNGQADECHPNTGKCFCHTRGVTGDRCDKCDEKHAGDPTNGGTCFYELNTNFQFTFSLSKEDNRYITQSNFINQPTNPDRDLDFTINCSSQAYMNLSIGPRHDPDDKKKVVTNLSCTYFKAKFSHKEYVFGSRSNNTFYVYVYDFKTPFIVQISFSQMGPIDLVHFFVTFFSCFLSLLLLAAIFWKVKQRYDMFRRRQRMVVEMEQMASRPFATTAIEVSLPASMVPAKKEPPDPHGTQQRRNKVSNKPCFMGYEPLHGNKAAIVSMIVLLPLGDEDYTPPGQSGLSIGCALVSCGHSRKSSIDYQKGDKASKHRKQPSAGAPDNCV